MFGNCFHFAWFFVVVVVFKLLLLSITIFFVLYLVYFSWDLFKLISLVGRPHAHTYIYYTLTYIYAIVVSLFAPLTVFLVWKSKKVHVRLTFAFKIST